MDFFWLFQNSPLLVACLIATYATSIITGILQARARRKQQKRPDTMYLFISGCVIAVIAIVKAMELLSLHWIVILLAVLVSSVPLSRRLTWEPPSGTQKIHNYSSLPVGDTLVRIGLWMQENKDRAVQDDNGKKIINIVQDGESFSVFDDGESAV